MIYMRKMKLAAVLKTIIRFCVRCIACIACLTVGGSFILIMLNYDFRAHKHSFEDKVLVEILREKPDYVFVGNSVVRAIDSVYFSKLTGGKVYTLVSGGGTGVRYLLLKNYVAASKWKPKRVLCLFIDDELTVFARQINDIAALEKMQTRYEPVYDSLVGSSVYERLYASVTHLPFVQVVRSASDSTSTAMQSNLLGEGEEEITKNINSFFERAPRQFSREIGTVDMDNYPDHYSRAWGGRYFFSRVINSTFLPHIIAVARDHDIPLVFVRVRIRPDPETNTVLQSDKLRTYIADLRQYLTKEGFAFYDLTENNSITADMYADNLHINSRDRENVEKYQRIFYNALLNEFE